MKTARIPKNPQQRWEWIKYRLRVKGSSFVEVANDLNVTRQAVRRVRVVNYPKMQKAIAKKIGMEPSSIWPERYAA